MEIFAVGLLAVCGLVIIASLYMLARNEWVYTQRTKLLYDDDLDGYLSLIDYNAMMRRWWVWDINKLRRADK